MQQPMSLQRFILTKTEVCFFITIFLLFPIAVDFEYNAYEKTGSGFSSDLFIERVVYGILGMIPYLIYYKVIIPYLFEKRYLIYVILVMLFLVLLHLSMRVDHWLVSKMAFLPTQLVLSAAKWLSFQPVLFQFSIIFVFRELLMVTALAYYLRSAGQEKQMHLLRRQQLETELNYLKIQLQPHFFFNTLNNIYALALEKSDDTAPLIARHAEMMRYIIYHSANPTVKLSEEIAFLQNYVAVESLRYAMATDIRFDVQGITDSMRIEPFILLPFVENAFKHGIREETANGFVHIVVCVAENELTMEVSNSKPERDESPPKIAGIGLKNTVARLGILYPDHQLAIHDTSTNYEIILNLTLTNHG